MLPYLLAHLPQIIAAAIAGGIYFAFRVWQAGGFKLPAMGTRKATVSDEQAFAAVMLLARYKADTTATAGRAAVVAALKTTLEGL